MKVAPVDVRSLDVLKLRADFPILAREINGYPLAYLDSAASAQTPRQVLDAMNHVYEHHYANVHRGVYTIAAEATDAYEAARDTVAGFVNASNRRECIFVRNATEGLNLVAYSYGSANCGPGDVIVCSEMEHHSNMVPWQLLASRTGASLRYIGVTDDGRLDLDQLAAIEREGRVRLVAIVHQSNTLGTLNPVREICDWAHAPRRGRRRRRRAVGTAPPRRRAGPRLRLLRLLGPQAARAERRGCAVGPRGAAQGHAPVHERRRDDPVGRAREDVVQRAAVEVRGRHACDRRVRRPRRLDRLPRGRSAWRPSPRTRPRSPRTPASAWRAVEGLSILGPPAADRGGVVSFTFAPAHPHDVAQIVDRRGVCVRAGHHCTQPLMKRFGVPATTRASFYLYTVPEEIDRLCDGLEDVREVFA